MKIVSRRRRQDKPVEFSKRLALSVYRGGMVITQECLFLIAYAIYSDFSATAAYLTAAIAVGQFMITVVSNRYLALAESDHSEGGITHDAAKAANFIKTNEDKASI
jgi:hypothetical protein